MGYNSSEELTFEEQMILEGRDGSDYYYHPLAGDVYWKNDIPILPSNGLNQSWRVNGNEIIAEPHRFDGGISISMRDDGVISTCDILFILERLDRLDISRFYECTPYNRFVIANAYITSLFIDNRYGCVIGVDITIDISTYLPDKFAERIDAIITNGLKGDTPYIYNIVPHTKTNRTCKYGNENKSDLFLGIGESPLEDKLFWALPHNIQQEIIPQFKIGKYRADFAIPSKKIVIEVDGEDYHNSFNQKISDYQRDRFMASQGWNVLRFTGKEVFNKEHLVIQLIEHAIKQPNRHVLN